MDQRSRREALIRMVQERNGINFRDPDYVHEPNKVAQEMCNMTLKHSNNMKALGLLREVDLHGLGEIDVRHHGLSARRAPFDNAKLLMAPFKINNNQTPYTVLLFDPLLIEQFQSKGYVQIPMGIFLDHIPQGILDGSAFNEGSGSSSSTAGDAVPTPVPQMDPPNGWWSKLTLEMVTVKNVIDLVEVGSSHLKAALDWSGKCIQGGTDSSNYTNLMKYYCGCKLQLRDGLITTASDWKKRNTPTTAKLFAEVRKPKDLTWKQFALQLRAAVIDV